MICNHLGSSSVLNYNMFWGYAITTIMCFVSVVKLGHCSRILAICPRASISHQIVFRGLTLALNRRGHELVVLTSDPVNDPTLKNYTEINASFLYNFNPKGIPLTATWLEFFPELAIWVNIETDAILDHPELRRLYAPNSGEKFDLLLLEWLYWPALLPLAERFDVPTIGLSPIGLPMNVQYVLGNPIMTSHPSNWEIYRKSEPSFYERVGNWISFWRFIYFYKTSFISSQQAIARKYFGDDTPDINELEKNISLVFVNQQPAISYVRPNVPKIIGIGGFHVSNQINPLPKDLQKVLDEATEGFVYMSLGSNMKTTMLSKETINEFIVAFSRLPFKVLWKFENEVLPGKPDNVHIMKWVPQQDVLAHPNLKAFVYQGGRQSTEEAVSRAVPLVGIPTWADQRMQVDRMTSLGVAKRLDFSAINRNDIEEAILTVSLDKSYKDNMLNLRKLLNDNSHNLLDNAVWWSEHIIRHKGAPHLHSITADEPWYRRQDMDVIAFISSVATIILCLILFIVFKLLVTAITVYHKLSVNKMKKVM